MITSSSPDSARASAPPPSARTRPSGPPAGADYSLRIVAPLAAYVADRFGADALRTVADAGGVDVPALRDPNRWIGWRGLQRLLATARALMQSDDEFKRACAYRLREGYGAMAYILWAATPGLVMSQASKHYAIVAKDGALSWTQHGRNSGTITFKNRVPFTRLTCLVRHAQTEALPTLWGLPPAHVRERGCVALGDPTCEIDVQWYEARRWFPVVVGAVALALVGTLLARVGFGSVSAPVAAGTLGAILGYLVETRRTERLNERVREEVMRALQEVGHNDAEARRELLEMTFRQKEWTRVVEDEMRARTLAFAKVAHGVTELNEARATALLGVSHDLRNPLQVIDVGTGFLRALPEVATNAEATGVLRDIDEAVVRMQKMLGELVVTSKAHRDFVRMNPQPIETRALGDSLKSRLRALMHGREIRTMVTVTSAAPAVVEVDHLALDRILDNLLTNAAKYTERGSVSVELGGTASFLVIKVTDTGRGISPQALERVFQPGGSSPESRRGDSFGVGLSVVVELLDQIGGRLEVQSTPDTGTTFWVHLPTKREDRPSHPRMRLAAGGSGQGMLEAANDGATRGVVTIRRGAE